MRKLMLNTATRLSQTSTCWRVYSTFARTRLLSVTYHRVGEDHDFQSLDLDVFRGQIEWLASRFRLIRGDEVRDALDGRIDGERIPLLITFDDGYRTLHSQVYPVLKAMNIPAVVFLPTALIGDNTMLWTDQIDWAYARTAKEEIRVPGTEDTVQLLRTEQEKRQASIVSKRILKSLPDGERRIVKNSLLESLDVDSLPIRQMMTWDEVREIRGTITPAAHSHTHPIMSRLEPGQVDAEVRTCRDTIEKETGVSPTLFAYPNGELDDFNERCQSSLQRHGFIAAFTTCSGANGAQANPFALARMPTTMPTANDLPRFMLRNLLA